MNHRGGRASTHDSLRWKLDAPMRLQLRMRSFLTQSTLHLLRIRRDAAPLALLRLSMFFLSLLMLSNGFLAAQEPEVPARPRLRQLGVQIGVLPTGQHNAITDVPGVAVGHQTIVRGESVCTGVTAILPHDGNVFLQKTPAAVHIANGFGKLVGSTQIQELGVIETPILLTNTLSTFLAADA